LKVFITGVSRGLGLEISKSYLESGHTVFGCARQLTSKVSELQAEYSGSFHFFETDLSNQDSLETIHKNVPLIEGLDACILNAAIGVDGLLATMSEDVIRQGIEVNLTSNILLAREAVKGMLLRQTGNLVFISSVAAQTGFKGLSVYSATKSAILGFSKTIAREYGSKGIRSNVVMPGFLETDMSSGLENDQMEAIRRRIPLKRLGTPKDIVGLITFLTSEKADYITGGEFIIDGGMSS